jgi:hypothetical protein
VLVLFPDVKCHGTSMVAALMTPGVYLCANICCLEPEPGGGGRVSEGVLG